MTCTTTIWQHRNSPFGPESPNRECDIQSISDDVALIPPPPTLYCRQRAQRHFPTFNPRRTDDTMIDTVSAVDQQQLPEQHLLTEQQQLSTATKMAKPPPFPRASDAPMHHVSSEEHTTHRKLDHKTAALLEAKRDSFASVDSKASTMGGGSTGSDALDEDVVDCDITDVNVGGVWKSRAGSCTTMASLSEVGEEVGGRRRGNV